MPKTITRLNVYIGFNSSLSGSIDMGDDFLVGLVMPDVWTPARVSIQVSVNNTEFHDLFDFDLETRTTAKEVVFNVPPPGTIVAINPNATMMARYIKLRSGTRDEPIDQAATCMFTLLTVDTIA
jgi:hypothetical protein